MHLGLLLDTADAQGAALSQLLFLRKRLADWHDLDALRKRFRAGIAASPAKLSPFCLLSDPSSRREQRQCAETWARGFVTKPSSVIDAAQGVGTDRHVESRDRLTIGYLSADFHMHATALLTAGLFERHDRKRYHVIAYSTGPDDQSPLRKRIENAPPAYTFAPRSRPHRPRPASPAAPNSRRIESRNQPLPEPIPSASICVICG